MYYVHSDAKTSREPFHSDNPAKLVISGIVEEATSWWDFQFLTSCFVSIDMV